MGPFAAENYIEMLKAKTSTIEQIYDISFYIRKIHINKRITIFPFNYFFTELFNLIFCSALENTHNIKINLSARNHTLLFFIVKKHKTSL